MSKPRLTILLILILLLSWFTWGLYATARQARLNEQLIIAVDRLDDLEVQRLLSKGADANTRQVGDPPSTWMVRLLHRITHRAPKRDDRGNPVLVYAAGKGDGVIVKALLAHGANPTASDETPDDLGNTPWSVAIDNDDWPIMQILLAAGVDINTRDTYGKTALCEAAEWGDVKTIQSLVKRGADLNHINRHDAPVLLQALRWDVDDHLTPLKVLLADGADVNGKDSDGQTPLMRAAGNLSPKAVRLLLAHGANINAQNSDGHSALWYVKNDRPDIPDERRSMLLLLRDHGAK